MFRDPIKLFRLVAVLEGISYLLLLFVAMPLKYMAGMPIWVRIVGSAHGALFVLYVLAMIPAARQGRWSFGQIAGAFIASLLPFGPFVVDHRLKHEAESAGPSKR